MPVKAIVCVDKNWGIGYNGELLFNIPEDMKFFKEKTINNTIVMGRKTYESIGKILPKRENIIITSSINNSREKIDNTSFFSTADFVDGYIVGCTKFNSKKIFYVIGGESIYKRYIDIYDEIFVTIVDTEKKSDRHFINLYESSNNYKLDEIIKNGVTKDGISYKITRWIPQSTR